MEETLQLEQMEKKEQKDKEALLRAQRIENENKKNLNDEVHILAGTYIKKELEDKQIGAEIMALKNNNTIFEGQENQWHQQLIKFTEEIKFLSTIREKMARTAS